MAYAFRRPTKTKPSYTGIFVDPDGVKRSAGTFTTKREAERAAHREETKVREGRWHDAARGEITFRDYAVTVWLPSRHIEASTLAGYQSYLNKQFFPFFGKKQMGKILPSDIQAWVTLAAANGLSASSIRQVPRDAALGVPSRRPRPHHRLQPVRGDRTPQGRHQMRPAP